MGLYDNEDFQGAEAAAISAHADFEALVPPQPIRQMQARRIQSDACRRLGDLDGAAAAASLALALAGPELPPGEIALSWFVEAKARFWRDDIEQALDALAQAERYQSLVDDRNRATFDEARARFLALRAIALLRRSDAGEARRALSEAEQLARALNSEDLLVDLLIVSADLALLEHDAARALSVLSQAVAQAERLHYAGLREDVAARVRVAQQAAERASTVAPDSDERVNRARAAVRACYELF
jgi:hypothetical protein